MLKTRTKRLADHGAQAIKQLAQIEASIVALADDDLLDLADIFKSEPRHPLGMIASVEMAKRNISLDGV